jgi:hypothetical protein
LSDEDNETPGCSVDPITGNLAAANFYADCHGVSCADGNIAIYSKAKGNPKLYSDPMITNYLACGYDNAGNLFVEGVNRSNGSFFAELRRGSNKITNLGLSIRPEAVQWDGKYVAAGFRTFTGLQIDRIAVHGSKATIVGVTTLDRKVKSWQMWLQGNTVLGSLAPFRVGLWQYPQGGKPTGEYSLPPGGGPVAGLTVSVAPK